MWLAGGNHESYNCIMRSTSRDALGKGLQSAMNIGAQLEIAMRAHTGIRTNTIITKMPEDGRLEYRAYITKITN